VIAAYLQLINNTYLGKIPLTISLFCAIICVFLHVSNIEIFQMETIVASVKPMNPMFIDGSLRVDFELTTNRYWGTGMVQLLLGKLALFPNNVFRSENITHSLSSNVVVLRYIVPNDVHESIHSIKKSILDAYKALEKALDLMKEVFPFPTSLYFYRVVLFFYPFVLFQPPVTVSPVSVRMNVCSPK
jgi:hypothetical protein